MGGAHRGGAEWHPLDEYNSEIAAQRDHTDRRGRRVQERRCSVSVNLANSRRTQAERAAGGGNLGQRRLAMVSLLLLTGIVCVHGDTTCRKTKFKYGDSGPCAAVEFDVARCAESDEALTNWLNVRPLSSENGAVRMCFCTILASCQGNLPSPATDVAKPQLTHGVFPRAAPVRGMEPQLAPQH
jgi:hypothetical protein